MIMRSRPQHDLLQRLLGDIHRRKDEKDGLGKVHEGREPRGPAISFPLPLVQSNQSPIRPPDIAPSFAITQQHDPHAHRVKDHQIPQTR